MGDALVHCIAVQDPDCLPMLAIARSASEAPSPFQDRWHGVLSIAFSSGEVGLDVAEDGRVTEVLPGSPAAGGEHSDTLLQSHALCDLLAFQRS